MGTGDRCARWGTTLAATAIAVLLAATGCGDDGSGDDDASRPVDGSTTSTAGDPTGPTEPADLDGRTVTVTSITDGDTFRAGDERVRLIGIDTPELDRDDCGADAATDALTGMIPVGTEVVLVSDVDPQDRYDRTLAYVHRLTDGLHVNLAMAQDGFAVPLVVEPNHAHAAEIEAAATAAVEAGRGLWDGTCPAPSDLDGPETTTASGPSSTAASPPGGPTTGGPAGACDPAYPTVCIPPSPPDLDCADIPHRRFPVLPPDPHRFDGGGDGVGCEA